MSPPFGYPLIGTFVEHVASELIPSAIRTRLYVSTESEDWVERVRSGTYCEVPNITPGSMPRQPITLHRDQGGHALVVEARPRTGHWNPCAVRVLAAERNLIEGIIVRPSKKVPSLSDRLFRKGCDPSDKQWWMYDGGEASTASPTLSMYAFFNGVPSRLFIGPSDGMVEVDFNATSPT